MTGADGGAHWVPGLVVEVPVILAVCCPDVCCCHPSGLKSSSSCTSVTAQSASRSFFSFLKLEQSSLLLLDKFF